MNDFKALQRSHELLLKSQQSGDDISENVKDYIEQVRISSSEIYQNAERDQLRSNLRYWASYLYEKTGMFPQLELIPPSTKAITRQKRANLFFLGVVFLGLVIVVFSLSLYPPLFFNTQSTAIVQTPTASFISPSTFKYGFDKDTMGWVPRRIGDQAVIDVQQQIKFGQSSLELQIELVGQDDQRSKGEVFVDLSSNPPLGEIAPLDLKGKPITMLVYIPSDAKGYESSPNGIQIFVRDSSNKSQYGAWTNLTSDNTDKWTIITLQPSSATEGQIGASTDAGFDPSKINIIGLKIGAGSSFDKAFIGSIWIDAISWP